MITFKITSNIPHLTSDSSTPADIKRMYHDATRNRSTVVAAEQVVSLLAQLVSDLAFPSIMDNAVRAAIASGRSITEELRTMRDEITEHSQTAKDEVRAYSARCAARQADIAPTLRACMNEHLSIDGAATELKTCIADFEKARQRCLVRYQEAGLGDADIALITVKPTFEDLSRWQRELQTMSKRKVALGNFLRSAPDYDLSLLNGDGVTNESTEV
jgi:hypothetical protein